MHMTRWNPAQPTLRLWRLRIVTIEFGCSFLLGGAAVFSARTAICLGVILAGLFLFLMLYWIPNRLRNARVIAGREAFRIQRGIWIRKRIFLPRRRILGFRLHQTPLERALGVWSVRLLTAGSTVRLFPLDSVQLSTLEQILSNAQ